MAEAIVHMGPMLVLAGLMVGWLAETVSRAGGYGFISDMMLGLAGSLVAGSLIVGGIFWAAISANVGMVAVLLTGCGGGTLAIIAQRQLWRSIRSGS
jgi:uncharacterized membrane protein YeaQ/YmgE (transglycosylase-associated protein family)